MANNEYVRKIQVTNMMPILEINEFPIRELKICTGCWFWRYHENTWCNNVDNYATCSYIDTPNSHIVETYGLLRTSQHLLFEMMKQNDADSIARMKEIIHELKDVINVYEKYIS